MIRKLFFVATALLGASAVFADTLTPEEALQRVNAQPSARRALAGNTSPQLVFTAKTLKGDASLYVFNKAKNNGYMILSADDIALPMLGYTDSGDFDPNNIPPMVKYWLDEYSNQIAYAKEHQEELLKSNSVTMDFPSSWTSIDPMISTNWNQGDPYNLMTPTYGNSHYSTGCVATAMAQVMKYWSYPEIGSGYISFYSGYADYPQAGYVNQTLSMNFDEQPFDWENMLDNYVSGQYNSTQANAVAYLMKACGYSAQMQYGQGGSGTQSELAGVALSKYFGYDRNITSEQRLKYSATEWNALVYDQLKNVGPIIYSGMSTEGAHCFVLDGYEGDGYFHFNWGWGGVCNGFYQLNALNPTQQGTGGFFGGYNFTQSILTGVQKPTGQPAQPVESTMTLNGTVEGLITVSGNNNLLKFTLTGANPPSIGNDSMEDFKPTFGYEFVLDKGGLPTYVTCGAPSIGLTFPPGSYWDAKDQASAYPVVFQGVIPANLAEGRYKVTVIVRNNLGTDRSWKRFWIAEGNYDYIYLTKTGDKFEIENFKPERFTMEKASINTPLYYNNPCEIEMTVTNPYDVEITQSVLPWLYIGSRAQYKGESQLITLMPKETKTVKMTTNFQRLGNGETPTVNNPKDFDLMIQNYNTGDFYGNFGTYAMKRSSTNARATLADMKITNAVELEEINGNKVYRTDQMSTPALQLDLEIKGGFIASPITISVFEYDLSTNKVGSQVYEKDIANIYAEAGESATLNSTLNFYDVNVGKQYLLSAYYVYNNNRRALGSVVMTASSGVQDILDGGKGFELESIGGIVRSACDSGKVILSIYDARGTLMGSVEGASPEYNLNSLAPGLYIIYARNGAGEVKTLKVIR